MALLTIIPLATLGLINILLKKMTENWGAIMRNIGYFPTLYFLKMPFQQFFYLEALWLDYYFTTWCSIAYTFLFPVFLITSWVEDWKLENVPYS